MESAPNQLTERANDYAASWGILLEGQLGFGFDGIVYSTNRQSAVKVFRHEKLFQRELEVYLRLKRLSIDKLDDFKIPV
jgi:hypothetical protein